MIAPASANTIAKLAAGLADNLLTSAALACTSPLVVAPGDEQRDVRAPRDAGEPRDAARARASRSSTPGTGALASKGEWGVGRLAEPRRDPRRGRDGARAARGLRAAVARRPARARHRRRDARADRQRALRRQPLVGADGLRGRGRGGGPRRRRDGDRRERLAAARGRRPLRGRRDGRRARGGGAAAVPRRRRPRDGGGGRRLPPAGAPRATKLSKTGRDALELRLEPTTDVLAALSAERRPGQTLVGLRRRARRGGRRARPRRSSSARGSTPSS